MARRAALLSACLVLALSERGCRPGPPSRGPLNVVLIVADALRASNLPAYGYFRDTAPNLTALGRHATVFRNHLANYPGTPVSVSQILTGRLMSPLLLHADLAVVPVKAIPRDLAVLPRVLREAGYRTGIVTGHPFLGQARLTQEFEGRFLVGPRGRAPYASLRDMMGPIQAFLGQASSDPRPFFLYVHPMDTHGPLQPHRRFARFRGQPAPPHYDEYDENILFTDHWVGRILAEIEDLGLADRTVFVFTSDHGEEFNEAGPGYWNAAHGYTLRRAQLHVPLIIRVPDDPRPGREYASLTSHIDLVPTLLRLAAPALPLERYRFDGKDRSTFWLDGRELPEEGGVAAFSMRYWGLFTRDLELQYDQWTGAEAVYAPAPDQYNYPALVPVGDPSIRRTLAQAAAAERLRRLEEFRALPPLPGGVPSARIGIPTTVDRERGSIPTYENRADDGLWCQDLWRLLECPPGERALPIVLSTPWAPGRYRVRLRLDAERLKEGYRDEFSFEILGPGSEVLRLRPRPGGPPLVDAGVHFIGDELVIRVSDPVGGVAITGLDLENLASTPAPAADPTAEERLRALGYVR